MEDIVVIGEERVGSQEVLAISTHHYYCLIILVKDLVIFSIELLSLKELDFHSRPNKRIRFFLLLQPIFENNIRIKLIFDILNVDFTKFCPLIPLNIKNCNIMLQLQIVLFFLVETSKDKEIALEFIAACTKSGSH